MSFIQFRRTNIRLKNQLMMCSNGVDLLVQIRCDDTLTFCCELRNKIIKSKHEYFCEIYRIIKVFLETYRT